MTDEEIKVLSAKRTRRSFLVAALAAAGGYEFYGWVDRAPGDEMIQRPLRKALNLGEAVSRGVFDERALTPTYPVQQSVEMRINGNYGLKQALVPESYRLQVVGVDGAEKMPQYVKDVTTWEYRYAAKETPYTGHDTKVALKEQGSGNAGSAKDMSKGAATGEASGAKKEAATAPAPDGGAHSYEPPNKDGQPAPQMAPEFAKALAEYQQEHKDKPQRGMEEAGESDSTLDPETPGLLLTMNDVTKLPWQDLVTQFKCIEGWSEIVHWGGYRLADFIAAYPPKRNTKGDLPKYVYMETPNGDYYTGYELQECMHPQNLLVTEMAGKPLTQMHGAPLRLHMPIKYGYKQIKCIGLIAYTDDKPDDYWTKLGYDWYAGL